MRLEAQGRQMPAREGLLAAIGEAWDRLARPGTWWTGADRVAIAAEARGASICKLCNTRKSAVSPYGPDGQHEAVSQLPPDAVEAVHRIATDASRITERWIRGLAEGGLGEERYVEIISIVAIVTAVDTFDLALGRPIRPLPSPMAGEPSRLRPGGARRDLAWVATLSPDAVEPDHVDPFPVHGDKNIHRALSLVPQEVFNFFDLDVELYLRDHEIRDFSREYRAISHRQIELIAGRASAINRCYY